MGNLSAGDSAGKLGREKNEEWRGFLSIIRSEKFARHVKAWTTEILLNICVHSTRYTRAQSLNRLNWESNSRRWLKIRDLSQKWAGGWGRWKQKEGHSFLRLRKGRGHKKWAVKRGRVMQIYGKYIIGVRPQKKKEVLYLVKKRRRKRRVEWSAVRIRVGFLMLSSKMDVYSITKNRLEIYFEFS